MSSFDFFDRNLLRDAHLSLRGEWGALASFLIKYDDFTCEIELVFQANSRAVVLRPDRLDVLAGVELEAKEAAILKSADLRHVQRALADRLRGRWLVDLRVAELDSIDLLRQLDLIVGDRGEVERFAHLSRRLIHHVGWALLRVTAAAVGRRVLALLKVIFDLF